MAGFAYFLPGLTQGVLVGPDRRLSRALLKARGLDETLADVESLDQCCVNDLHGLGPGDLSGILLYPLPPDGKLPARMTGYYPAQQIWGAAFDEPDGFWVGFDPAESPCPSDLARRGEQFAGYDLELTPGQRWTIPVVRRPNGVSRLPCDITFDRSGGVKTAISERFRPIWTDMEPYIDSIFFGAEKGYEVGRAIGMACRLLGINYRFGLAEQNAIRTLTTTNWGTVLQAAMDLPFYQELVDAQKKTESPAAETSTTATGSPADCPTTDPAAASC